MTDSMEDIYDGDIYEGAPAELPRSRDGIQDEPEAMQLRSFVSNLQRNTAQTLEWYTTNRSNPPFDPDGMCLKVCRTARNIGAMFASAKEAQDATPMEHRYESVAKARKGMIAYFDTVGDSNPYGHIVTIRGRRAGIPLDDLDSLAVETNSVKANELVVVRGGYFRDYWGDQFKFASDWLNGQVLDLPEPPAPVVTESNVRVMHISMRTFLNENAWRADCEKIFDRAETRLVGWVTGTEASKVLYREILRDVAEAHGFRVRFGGRNDSWVAVNVALATGPIVGDYDQVITEPRTRGIVHATFPTKQYGEITVAACHYLRYGRPDPATDEYQVYLRENRQLARKLAEIATAKGRGASLFFYGGDQNIVDKKSDTFFGGPLTSTWDELGRWDNTGHGNIDVIASFDNDGRVTARSARALDDSEFKLNSDHYLVESVFTIKHVKGA